MQSPNKFQTSDSDSCTPEQPTNPNIDRDVNIVTVGKMENTPTTPTTITIRCREIVIKFSSENPVAAVCEIVRNLDGSLL